MSRLIKILKIAEEVAREKSQHYYHRHGAVCFHNFNNIVTRAGNVADCSFGSGLYQHAEVGCLRRLVKRRRSKCKAMFELNNRKGAPKSRRSKLKLLVCRVNRDGTLGDSRPCQHCISFMRKIGVYQVWYTNEKGKLVAERVQNMKSKHVCSSEHFVDQLTDGKPWLRPFTI